MLKNYGKKFPSTKEIAVHSHTTIVTKLKAWTFRNYALGSIWISNSFLLMQLFPFKKQWDLEKEFTTMSYFLSNTLAQSKLHVKLPNECEVSKTFCVPLKWVLYDKSICRHSSKSLFFWITDHLRWRANLALSCTSW